MEFRKKVEIRWSDLDPNFHLRHSAYYDFGAYCRVAFLAEQGITGEVMKEKNIGPVLFREECFFKREIVFGDDISVTLKLRGVSKDYRKFSMQHEIFKNETELAATITLDGAWIDTEHRKIIVPPEIVIHSFEHIEKTEGFKFI